jgi:histidinol-phosphate aminotransferase
MATERGYDARPIRLSLNENPFGPSPLALEAISNLTDLSSYAGPELATLKALISSRERIPSDQIVVGEILHVVGLYLSATGAGGNEFVYSMPGYTALVDAVAPGGGVVIGVPLNRRLENDLPAIAERVNARTRAVFLVNPHNPSGTVSDATEFLEFVQRLAKRTPVIVDEAYLEFTPDFEHRTVAGLVREGANVALFRTFSKIYGLAGLAIGYVLAPRELASSMSQIGIGAFFEVNRLSLAAAQASLQDTDYVTRVRKAIKLERQEWHKLFPELGVNYAEAQANFVFFDAGQPHQVVADILATRGIEIGRSHAPLDTWVRISIGLPDDNIIARQTVSDLLR